MRVYKYRVTYLAGGVRHITFFGTNPTGHKRMTLLVPQLRDTHNRRLSLSTDSSRQSNAGRRFAES
jgi:hypothetical protein